MAAKLNIAAQTEALLLSPVWGFTPGVAVGCWAAWPLAGTTVSSFVISLVSASSAKYLPQPSQYQ